MGRMPAASCSTGLSYDECMMTKLESYDEPAPGFAQENSINHALSSSATYFSLSMSLDLSTRFELTIFVATFGTD